MDIKARESCIWRCRGRELSLETPLVMGILNVTPDSFYDGGRFDKPDDAVAHAREMVRDGADIIDVGGESTRPGADAVDVESEIQRVIPVIKRIAGEVDALVSIDTRHVAVASAALDAGADIINNIMVLNGDAAMADLVARSGAGLVVMHMRGSPRTMNTLSAYDDVELDVSRSLQESFDYAVSHGVDPLQIVVDPGIGFAKETQHNLKLIAGLERLTPIAPVLVGASRKRFVGEICNAPDAGERVGGSIGAAVMSVLHGASIVRVHDVKESAQALAIVNALRKIRKAG